MFTPWLGFWPRRDSRGLGSEPLLPLLVLLPLLLKGEVLQVVLSRGRRSGGDNQPPAAAASLGLTGCCCCCFPAALPALVTPVLPLMLPLLLLRSRGVFSAAGLGDLGPGSSALLLLSSGMLFAFARGDRGPKLWRPLLLPPQLPRAPLLPAAAAAPAPTSLPAGAAATVVVAMVGPKPLRKGIVVLPALGERGLSAVPLLGAGLDPTAPTLPPLLPLFVLVLLSLLVGLLLLLLLPLGTVTAQTAVISAQPELAVLLPPAAAAAPRLLLLLPLSALPFQG